MSKLISMSLKNYKLVCFVQVAMNILNSGRFGMGAAAAGGLRKLIGGLFLKNVDFDKCRHTSSTYR